MPEGDGAQVAVHVVVDIFRVIQHAFVNAEKELRFSGVRDNALGEIDAAITLTELAGEYLFHVGADDRAVYNGLDTAGDDVILNMNAGKAMLRGKCSFLKVLKKLGDSFEESEFFSQLSQGIIADSVNAEGVQQFFKVAQLAIPAFFLAAIIAFFPEQISIDTELREDGILLHVVGAESLVKIKDECDSVLRYCHASFIARKWRYFKQNQVFSHKITLPVGAFYCIMQEP